MPRARHEAAVASAASILERPVYGVVEAAGLLGLRSDRVRAWLDGYAREGVRYAPVIRPEPTGDDLVTWGEFVELGYLREYRRKGVPLQRLRPVIDELRRELGTPYPLATAKPFIADKDLVLTLQEKSDLPGPIAIVVRSGQQIILAADAQRFLKNRWASSAKRICWPDRITTAIAGGMPFLSCTSRTSSLPRTYGLAVASG